MVLNIFKQFAQKPDSLRFRQRIRFLARLFGLLSLTLLLLAICYQSDDFGRGFLVGLSLSLGGCSLVYWRLLRDNLIKFGLHFNSCATIIILKFIFVLKED